MYINYLYVCFINKLKNYFKLNYEYLTNIIVNNMTV